MRIHSYTIKHDYGFAPNPFYGYCTLATCKPRIREHASVGDYVIGTGSAKRNRRGYLTYFMRVEEILAYDQYWLDERFQRKKPCMNGSVMQAFGDNIYHQEDGQWLQEESFHSMPDGSANNVNLDHDTKSEKLLVSQDFAYWGGTGPEVPQKFRNFDGVDLVFGRGHRNNFPWQMVDEVVQWLRSLDASGYVGEPVEWTWRSEKYTGNAALHSWS
ncbi:MAG: hypothetical protein ACE37H_05005 [Phycisphaeraceae bacterium]